MNFKESFINEIGAIAVKVCKQRGYSNAQLYTCIAQACNESAYGKSELMRLANAYFGIKATKSWVSEAKYGGLVFSSKTKEVYNGNTVSVDATFRAYKCMEDSVNDYFDLLELDRYKASLKATTVRDCITAIKNGGYATSPTYVDDIMNFYNVNAEYICKFSVGSASNVDITSVAKDVIAGKYGNGSERKTKLEQAGYSYSEVQSKVNELLGKSNVDITSVAKDVIAGKYGNGNERKVKLEKAGYSYSVVQKKVNELLSK